MLHRAERFTILRTIKFCCKAGCFPFTIDVSTWQLIFHTKSVKQLWPSLCYFGGFVIHVMYKVITLICACFLRENLPLYELTIHGIMALSGTVVSFWYYDMFIRHRGVFGAYLNLTLLGNIGGCLFDDSIDTKWTKRLKKYSLQDWIAISLPYMAVAVIVTYLAVGIYYPKLQLLLCNGLPENYQSWLSFSALLLEEMRYIIMFCVVAMPIWTLQIISLDLVNTRLMLFIKSTERAMTKSAFRRIYSKCRHLQLFLGIINFVNRYLIFSWKFMCITICIGAGYAAIAHFTDHPVFGVLYCMILIDAMVVYTSMYGKAFKCQALFQKATHKALLQLQRGAYQDVQLVKRQMRSIPRVGIKVGEFHVIERESIPIFVHYVLSNIIGMLVAYGH